MTTTTSACGARFIKWEGVVSPLTPCCDAAATGVSATPGNPDGIACKACYHPVAPLYARQGLGAVRAAVAERGCPVPGPCAEHVLWTFEQDEEDWS